MDVLYVAEIDIKSNVHLGILNKIIGQLKAFEKNGVDVDLYCYNNGKPFLAKSIEDLRTSGSVTSVVKMDRMRFRRDLGQLANKYDVVYIRFSVPDFLILHSLDMIKALKFLEIPTPLYNYVKEFRKDLIHVRLTKEILYRLFIKKYLASFDYIVQIGGNKDNFLDPNKILIISNGIDMDLYPLKKNYFNNQEFHLIGVANVHYWHGYDRVVKGLADYYKSSKDRKVFFHIVGEGAGIPKLKEMVSEYNLNDYVIFHGAKVGEELKEIFDKCHIAVGGLGLHRNEIEYGSTLKVREYCARGIPFILAYNDTDFPPDFPFMKKFNAEESPINIEEVMNFYENIINSYPNYNQKMREFAETNLSWVAKIKPIVEKMHQEVVKGNVFIERGKP